MYRFGKVTKIVFRNDQLKSIIDFVPAIHIQPNSCFLFVPPTGNMTGELTPTSAKTSASDGGPDPEASTEVTNEDANAAIAANASDELTPEQLREKRCTCFKKVFIFSIIVGFIIFVIVDLTTTGYLKQGIKSFLNWIQRHPVAGLFAFTAIYFAATGKPNNKLNFGKLPL